MIDFIYNTPSFILFIITSFSFILFSLIITKLVHQYVPLKFRYVENQTIVCVSALIGIIYAVLIGFIVLYELNNFNKASDAEISEAKAVFSIFRMADILPEDTSKEIKQLTVDYIKNAIHNEWPTMETGKHPDKTGVAIIEEISKKVRSFKNLKALDTNTIQALNMLSIDTNTLFDIHQERSSKVHSALSANIWFVLLLCTLLTIGINCILGMEFRLHVVSIIFISLIVSAVLYLIITLDRPYRGDFSIKPVTFISTLDYIDLKNIQPVD